MRLLPFTLLFILAFPAFSQQLADSSKLFNLRNGSLVSISILDRVSSENETKPRIEIAKDVNDDNGKILVKQGTPVEYILKRNSRDRVGEPGDISIMTVSVKSVDGQDIRLYWKNKWKGKNKRKAALGSGISIGIVSLPFLGLLAIKGGKASIPANTVITDVPVMGNYTIK